MDPTQSHFAAHIRERLETRQIGQALRVYSRLESTNTTARAWAREGAPEGALVLARQQTAGRGRHGRSWEAAPDQNLTFSLVLRSFSSSEQIGLLPLVTGLAVARMIDRLDDTVSPRIKWPNDVLVGGRKLCGILVERDERAVVLGIGLNVNQTDFPAELEGRATSLACAVGRRFELSEVLAEMLLELERHLGALGDGEAARLRRSYQRRMAYLGEEVELQLLTSGRSTRGRITGIARGGGLRMQTSAGDRTFYAGDVTFSSTD